MQIFLKCNINLCNLLRANPDNFKCKINIQDDLKVVGFSRFPEPTTKLAPFEKKPTESSKKGKDFLALRRILHAVVLISNVTTLVYFLMVCVEAVKLPIVHTDEFLRHELKYVPYLFSLWVTVSYVFSLPKISLFHNLFVRIFFYCCILFFIAYIFFHRLFNTYISECTTLSTSSKSIRRGSAISTSCAKKCIISPAIFYSPSSFHFQW